MQQRYQQDLAISYVLLERFRDAGAGSTNSATHQTVQIPTISSSSRRTDWLPLARVLYYTPMQRNAASKISLVVDGVAKEWALAGK